jgi:hypothetical protein
VPGPVPLGYRDMFSGSADLILMSCSTGGMITRFADDRMQRFVLPPPSMPLGEVRLLPLIRVEHVAHAAPVRGYESASEALGRICEEFGRATQEGIR